MLRRTFIGLLMLGSVATYGQFTDNFTDGNFTANPTWAGEAVKFEIAHEVLHLNDAVASGSAYLSTPSEAVANATWELYVEISENPSSSNFARIYLMASQADLSGELDGYFVKVGGSEDEVNLYRQDGSSMTKIIDGPDGRVDTKPVQISIRVTRDAQGNWQLLSRPASEVDFISEGEVYDNTHTVSHYFGVQCQYTSTRKDAFYFDDFVVTGFPQPDTTPPSIEALSVLSATQLQLTFSEDIETTSAQVSNNYALEARPVSIVQAPDTRTVILTWETPLANGSVYSLTIGSIQDEAGNTLVDTTLQFRYFVEVAAQWQDVVINEWMPDPNPVVTDLPEAEFIELFNQSAYPFRLQGWTLNDKSLPNYLLLPNQYIILSPTAHTTNFAAYGEALGLNSWPTLPNGGGSLLLKNANGQAVDSLSYRETLVEGGYAIERIRPNRPCDQRLNYTISLDANGGTPGVRNSLFTDEADTQLPELRHVTPASSREVRLHFDEAVATSVIQVALSPTVSIAQIQTDSADERMVVLYLTEDLASGTTYTVMVSQARDCYGNEATLLNARFYYDNQPPIIERVVLRDTASLQIIFNEPLSSTKDEHYFIGNGIGKARAVQWVGDSSSVLVDFSASLDNGLRHPLRVTNATDRYGNIADSLAYHVTFQNNIDTVRVVSAYQVDIVFTGTPSLISAQQIENYRINRGMEHPNAVVVLSLNAVQLIYDRPLQANRAYELQVEHLADTQGEPLNTPIYRFSYDQSAPSLDAVVAIDERTLIAYFNEAIAWDTKQSPTAFTVDQAIGSPERIELLPDAQSFKLYLSRSLNQETTYELSAVGLADRSGNGSTSTKKKTFFYDQQAPSLRHWQLISPNQLRLDFHEPLEVSLARSPQNYTLASDIHPDSVAISGIHPGQITLFFANPLSGSATALQITQLADLYGNVLSEPVELLINHQTPALGSVVPLSATELRLNFTKPLDAAVMEAVDNYYLDRLGLPSQAVVGGAHDASVTLTWATPLAAAHNYLLAIRRLTDPSGTTVEGTTTTFVYDTKVGSITPDGSALTVDFTVPLDRAVATDVLHYHVAKTGAPVAAVLTSPHTVRLVFAKSFAPQAVHVLTLNGLLDQDRNVIPNSQHRFGQGKTPGYHQLLITELMADPSPAVGLPEAEYVELFNASDQLLSTQGLRFSDASTTVVLPTTFLAPQEYVILCGASDQAALSPYGRTISVSNLPTLNSTGDSLRLSDAHGQEIFALTYSDDWYNDAEKRSGGWSLEMVDPQRPCGEQDNWIASVDPTGGTPGQENSVRQANPDRFGPQVLRAFAISDTSVWITFSEKLNAASTRFAHIQLSDGLVVRSTQWLSTQKEAIITLGQKLQTARTYSVQIHGVTDCSGNLISDANTTVAFVLPEAAANGDILLSELLFHPRSSGEKFVELYNYSDKHIDLKDWSLANLANDSLTNVERVTNTHYVLAPGQYVALTEDPLTLKADYPAAPEERLLKVSSLPSLPAEEGTILLLNPAQEVMQQFRYSDSYHHSLLTTTQGVSLERIVWDNPANDPTSWQSAAKTVNYATPGYRNSQQAERIASQATISVDPSVFAPGYAGHADYTRIHYHFSQPGTVANVIVYDAQGRKIRDLAQNTTLAETGFLVWDGTTNDRQRVGIGYYLIFFEVFDTQGRVNVFKEKVVVGGSW